jgi:hypothetical protein
MKKRLLMALLSLALIGVMFLPSVTWAQVYPDMEGVYMCKSNLRLYTMNNAAVYPRFRYIGISITDQTDGTISVGELIGYETNTVRGNILRNILGVVTGAPLRLVLGANTVPVATVGTISIYLPAGVEGVAASGTTTVTASPLTLPADTTTTVTTTGIAGNITITLNLVEYVAGTLVGTVGEGNGARFTLIGTSVVAILANGTGIATGSPVRCIPASTTITVTQQGNFTVTLPEGNIGTATSGTCTVTNSPLPLVAGANVVAITGTGNFTVELSAYSGYILNGRVFLDNTGDVSHISGRITGFFIFEPADEWILLNYTNTFRGNWDSID